MAIIAYTGVMGSGKTYEAVSTAALGALRAGRRVVTNISGFNFEAIRDHLGPFKDGSHLEADRVLVVSSQRVTQPHFFYDPDSVIDSVVKPGDLVLIDEVWSFWGAGVKLLSEHQKFFRMHRHYTEQGTGVSCDLCIMIQDLSSLHRFIRGVIETSYKFTKMKSLGLSSRYRVEVYEGGKPRRATLISASVKKYNKEIFPLYQSYEGGAGTEKTIDDRQNLFSNKGFVFFFVLSFVVLLGGGYWFLGWLDAMQNGATPQASLEAVSVQETASPMNTPSAIEEPSSGYRLAMVLETPRGETLAFIETPDGHLERRLVTSGVIDGWHSTVGYKGRMLGFVFGGESS